MLQIAIDATCGSFLVYAALHDVATRTIPNFIPAILVGFGFIHDIVANTTSLSAAVAGTVFAVALLVWRAGLFGGGDVKLLTSASLLISPREVPMLLASIALIGGMLACMYIVARSILPLPGQQHETSLFRRITRVELWRIHRHGSLPYASAIAIGTITQLVRH